MHVEGATVSRLAPLLDPAAGGHVWIFGHWPEPALRWWEATVPLDRHSGTTFTGQVRCLRYELQMPTAAFLEQAPAFDRHGLYLVQADRPMPDTLWLDRIDPSRHDAVLVGNGAVMSLSLPHAVETAQVIGFTPGLLAARARHLPPD